MKFGIRLNMSNSDAWEMPYAERYESDLVLAEEADELGLDNIWIPEHHFERDGFCACNLTVAAAMLARTKRIRVGTYVVLLPMHSIVRLAEIGATLDVLSNGRFDLGLGTGYRPEEFSALAPWVNRKVRGSLLEEGAELIKRLWGGTEVSFHGRHFSLENISVYPRPVQKPYPPIWMAGRTDETIDRVARGGYHYAGSGVPELGRKYGEALRRHGRNPGDYFIAQMITGYISDTKERAWDECEKALHYFISRYTRWVAQDVSPASPIFGKPDSPQRRIPSVAGLRKEGARKFFGGPYVIGTPEDMIRAIEDRVKRGPITHIAFGFPSLAPDKMRNNLRLFAKEVVPHFRS